MPRVRGAARLPVSKTWYDRGYHSDQGATPECVGHGWAHWLHASPFRQFLQPHGIYTMAQHLDEWEGTDYDGTSVRAGAKVLQMLGAIGEYRWATQVVPVAKHILANGPVVIGVNWYEGMEEPDPGTGLIRPTGEALGGHCACLIGFDGRRGQFKLKNSWGTEWGLGGYAWIGIADLQRLLDEDGEACCGLEQALKPA